MTFNVVKLGSGLHSLEFSSLFKSFLKYKYYIIKNDIKSDENSPVNSLDLLATTAGQRHLNVICNCKIAPFA